MSAADWDNRIITGDARDVLDSLPPESVDLSFWSPPYYVGKSYEKHLSFTEWQSLLRDVIVCHRDVLRNGGFIAINADDTIWLVGRDAPTLGEDFRVRLNYRRLSEKADWRVQEVSL